MELCLCSRSYKEGDQDLRQEAQSLGRCDACVVKRPRVMLVVSSFLPCKAHFPSSLSLPFHSLSFSLSLHSLTLTLTLTLYSSRPPARALPPSLARSLSCCSLSLDVPFSCRSYSVLLPRSYSLTSLPGPRAASRDAESACACSMRLSRSLASTLGLSLHRLLPGCGAVESLAEVQRGGLRVSSSACPLLNRSQAACLKEPTDS